MSTMPLLLLFFNFSFEMHSTGDMGLKGLSYLGKCANIKLTPCVDTLISV